MVWAFLHTKGVWTLQMSAGCSTSQSRSDSNWSSRQVTQVKGSVPQDCFHAEANSKSRLSPMLLTEPAFEFGNLQGQLTELRENSLLVRLMVYYKRL